MKRTAAEIERRIVVGYLRGQSSCAIAAQLGMPESTVLAVLGRNGVERRNPGADYAKYVVDLDYFAKIDTEAKAYWLGFAAADGNVTDQGKFQLGLAAADADHLEKFRAAAGYSGPVLVYDRGQSSCNGKPLRKAMLTIARQRFAAHLVALGIVPRKTFCCEPPPPGAVPAELLRHYWRGVFDGDGSISTTRGGRNRRWVWDVGIVGTKAMADGFAAFVRAYLGIGLCVTKKRNIWRASSGGVANPQAVARLLYEGATVYLDRKKRRVDRLLSVAPERSRFLTVNGATRTYERWANDVGLTVGGLRLRLWNGWSPELAVTRPARRTRRSTSQ